METGFLRVRAVSKIIESGEWVAATSTVTPSQVQIIQIKARQGTGIVINDLNLIAGTNVKSRKVEVETKFSHTFWYKTIV
jgi:hypothetical protein